MFLFNVVIGDNDADKMINLVPDEAGLKSKLRTHLSKNFV